MTLVINHVRNGFYSRFLFVKFQFKYLKKPFRIVLGFGIQRLSKSSNSKINYNKAIILERNYLKRS